MVSDLVVVGAGIVGLAHAVAALERGLSVTVVERDERAVGASVRNFGHGCVSGQVGEALSYASAARSTWLRMSRAAGFWAAETGTLVVARSDDELAALSESGASPLTARQVRDRAPISADGLVGGAFLAQDLRVDPRGAVPAIAAWVAAQPGGRVLFSTPATGVEPGVVHTPRGDVLGSRVVVCPGHDLDRLLPDLADEIGLRRCTLRMLQVRPASPTSIPPAVLTGSSLLRYPAFAGTPGAGRLRSRWTAERPDLLAAGVNHMLTQRPDGDLVIGDTHAYARTPSFVDPLDSEELDDLILTETRALLDLPGLRVVHRWTGIYAGVEGREFLHAEVAPGVTAVVVTTGIGMTTAFGLAAAVLDGLTTGRTG